MSTQNFSNNTEKAAMTFTVFLIFSIAIHFAMVLSFLAFSPVYKKLTAKLVPEEPEAVVVDVVELPPDTGRQQRPLKPLKAPTHYAERANAVEKETFPEAGKTGNYRPGIIIPATEKPVKATASKDTNQGITASGQQRSSASGAAGTKGEGISKEKVQADRDNTRTGSKTAKKEGAKNTDGVAAKPSLFLPEETISALERKYEAESPKGEQGKTLNLNTSELRYSNYLINMKRRIELYWEYPEVAARNGWNGRLFINFTIKKDGTLGEIILAKSSGYPALDDAAITALKLAAPYSAFPENFGIEQINIKGQFEYDFIYSHPR